jgi:8-oxo-dGTP pyrophosphatase MutT (NUDIX family)
MRNPWKTLSTRVAYSNPWIRVREDEVRRPDGTPGLYGVVEIRPSVGIVARNERDEIVLAGQWRYPLQRYSLEIPRGGSGEGETDMLAVARRELREEVGVEARRWRRLAALDLNNGVTNDVEHLFLAEELCLVDPSREPDEEIRSLWVPFARSVEMVMSGEITEVCSVAAILMVNRLFLV